MQKDPLISAMVGALFLGTAAVLVLAIGFEYHARQIRSLQPKLVEIQNAKVLVDSLARDAVEYSKHNPAIFPILQAVGVNKPTAK